MICPDGSGVGRNWKLNCEFDSCPELNPATEFCLSEDGRIEIRGENIGGNRFCVLPSGTECEEWAFYKNVCGDKEKSADPAKTDDNLFEQSNHISSEECRTKKGEIIDIDPKNPECPDDREFFGMVGDVNCICACCGNIQKKHWETSNISAGLRSYYLDYHENDINQVDGLDLHDLPCWLTTFEELSDQEIAGLDRLNIVINDYHLFEDHLYNVNLSISVLPDLAEFSFVKNLKGAWGIGNPEIGRGKILLDG